MTTSFGDILHDSPVIAAVKSDEGLGRALTSGCAVVFLLYGTILDVGSLAARAKSAGKLVLVHADLVDGLAPRDIAADFLARTTAADGLISTHPSLVRRAKELGRIAVQRFFLLDSISFENATRQNAGADAVDILPGTMPDTVRRLAERTRGPLIASGLLTEKRDVMAALSAGAAAVSTTCEKLWFA